MIPWLSRRPGLFTPEINGQAIGYPAGQDWTSDNAATMQYDSYKARAVLNEIDGFDHSRTSHVLNSSTLGNVLLMFGKSLRSGVGELWSHWRREIPGR